MVLSLPIFKYLGLKIEFHFKDDIIRQQLSDQLKVWLSTIDDSPLTGPQKSWIANHIVCQKLAWSLLIHEFCSSQAEDWARVVHRSYRKWMGLAHSAEPLILYRSNTHFGLAFKHLGAMHKQLQIAKWHIMKHSRDPSARAIFQRRVALDRKGHTGTGRKFAPSLEVQRLEGLVQLERVTGVGQIGGRVKKCSETDGRNHEDRSSGKTYRHLYGIRNANKLVEIWTYRLYAEGLDMAETSLFLF